MITKPASSSDSKLYNINQSNNKKVSCTWLGVTTSIHLLPYTWGSI